MVSPIIFFASALFGINCVQATDMVYDHKVSFGSVGSFLQVFWNDVGGYEVATGATRYEYNAFGVLAEALFGSDKYSFDALSNSCNSPEGVTYSFGHSETRTTNGDSFTCDECNTMADELCGDGLTQLCDYSPTVAGNTPPFYAWAKNAWPKMCVALNAACELERPHAECLNKCTDPMPPVYVEDTDCPEECGGPLDITLMWDTNMDMDLRVTEGGVNGTEVFHFNTLGVYGTYGTDYYNAYSPETYTMFSALTGSDMLGSYGIEVDHFSGASANYGLTVSAGGVPMLHESGTLSSGDLSDFYTFSLVSYEDSGCAMTLEAASSQRRAPSTKTP